MQQLEIKTEKDTDIIDITTKVSNNIEEIEEGICTVYVPHTTAGITVNEAEENLKKDIKEFLEKSVPIEKDYQHNKIDNNAHSHLRSILLGSSISIPVEKGSLALGSWQSILFIENDGPRRRKIKIKTVKS